MPFCFSYIFVWSWTSTITSGKSIIMPWTTTPHWLRVPLPCSSAKERWLCPVLSEIPCSGRARGNTEMGWDSIPEGSAGTVPTGDSLTKGLAAWLRSKETLGTTTIFERQQILGLLFLFREELLEIPVKITLYSPNHTVSVLNLCLYGNI